MRHFDQIIHTYNETDAFLRQMAVAPSGHAIEAASLIDTQGINERAYFVLLVAQFEDLVNGLVDELVTRNRLSAGWPHRKLWDNLVANNRKVQDIPFKIRLALLVEDTGGVEYQHACGLYDVRNRIAHGTLDSSVSIQSAIRQLLAIASLIQEVP